MHALSKPPPSFLTKGSLYEQHLVHPLSPFASPLLPSHPARSFDEAPSHSHRPHSGCCKTIIQVCACHLGKQNTLLGANNGATSGFTLRAHPLTPLSAVAPILRGRRKWPKRDARSFSSRIQVQCHVSRCVISSNELDAAVRAAGDAERPRRCSNPMLVSVQLLCLHSAGYHGVRAAAQPGPGRAEGHSHGHAGHPKRGLLQLIMVTQELRRHGDRQAGEQAGRQKDRQAGRPSEMSCWWGCEVKGLKR